jgi:hypothetical protein
LTAAGLPGPVANTRAKIELPTWRQYKPGVFLTVRPLTWDEINDQDYDDENWVDPAAPSDGRSRPCNGNDNDDRKGELDTEGGEKCTGKMQGAKDGKGKWKATEDKKGKGKAMEERKGKWNGTGKGIVQQTPGGESSQCSGNATAIKGNGTRRAN